MAGIRFMHYHFCVPNTKVRIGTEEAAIVSKLISKEEGDEIREYDGN